MKIAVDAMGGDHAPRVVVDGAVLAARAYGLEITLVGPEDVVRAELARHKTADLPITIVHAPEVVGMTEHPLAVKQKKANSMLVGARLVKEGRADAFASAGNSGAVMAAALFGLGRIRGIERPALGTIWPASPTPCILLDIGANTDPKPEYLVQFAIMGVAYAERMFGLQHPRVGIVSNGEEAEKGSFLVRDTCPLLQASGLNFIGNVEGKDTTRGIADVIVTDGFTGNVIIKEAEGIASFMSRLVKRELTAGALNKTALVLLIPGLILMLPGLLLLSPTLRRLTKRLDYREIGGAPLLGVDGVVVIGHGRSDARAIQQMIFKAARSAEQGLVPAIQAGLAAWQKATAAAREFPALR
ncbi:MAG: phosphate acyltransferase PlsX [Anaerolineae bacterium]|nr:phosphate acyltransferase PlsX [Anaerolineae bacterium]